ncbi:MAG: hypothetical protein IVW36_00745 [Dehalococcoidia bacterium]|nr:hypothetical protein [Dehalococcoidia bacterium]
MAALRFVSAAVRAHPVWGALCALLLSLVFVTGCTASNGSTVKPTSTASTAAAATATASGPLSPTVIPPSPTADAGDTDATAVGTPLATGGVSCGTERWPVKTLSDADAGNVSFSPVPLSFSVLRALPAPASLPQDSRDAPVEDTTYAITANVVEFKQEDDHDIHVVIADPSDASATMIVEFPDAADCTGAVSSADANAMKAARAALIAA